MGNDLSIDDQALRFQRDHELPYNSSYNMSQPIGSTIADLPATSSRPLARTHNDIRQITTVSEGKQNIVDVSDISRLACIPTFLPLLHNYLDLSQLRRLNASLDKADTALTKQHNEHTSLFSSRFDATHIQLLKSKPLNLNHRPILDLSRLCENILKNAAELIDSDQSNINSSIKKMDSMVHGLHIQIVEHRANLFRITEQQHKLGDMLAALTRINNTLSRVKPALNQLNSNLPENLRLVDKI